MTEALLTADGLSRNFGDREVVTGVSFSVPRAQSIGLLGPNGAGKTTIFRMLAGCLAPTRGSVRVLGKDMRAFPKETRKTIGYMPESAQAYLEMTAREYLRFRAELSGRCPNAASVKDAAIRSLQLAHVDDAQDRPLGTLSKGYRQRVMLAAALVGDPPVMLLDEPTAGLDPNQVLEVRTLIRELSRERAIIVSTHVLSEVEAACSHALILNEGRLIASGSLAELKSSRSAPRMRVVYRGALPDDLASDLRGASCLLSDDVDGQARALVFTESATITRSMVLGRLALARIDVLEFAPLRAPLDEVFAELTRLSPERAPGDRGS